LLREEMVQVLNICNVLISGGSPQDPATPYYSNLKVGRPFQNRSW